MPHHLIDVADPEEQLTLARYLDSAHAALDDVWARGKLPVLAGGSGQYVWALLEGWQVPRVAPDLALRAELEALDDGTALLDAPARSSTRRRRRASTAQTRGAWCARSRSCSATGRPLAACQTRQPDRRRRADPRPAAAARRALRPPRRPHRRHVRRRLRRRGAPAARRRATATRRRCAAASATRGLAAPRRQTRPRRGDPLHKLANHRLVRRQNAWFKPATRASAGSTPAIGRRA